MPAGPPIGCSPDCPCQARLEAEVEGPIEVKGWFVGGGDEYALNIVPGLFWKNEYRFSRYDGEFNRPWFLLTGNLAAIGDHSEKWTHTVRSELVYRFNWGGVAAVK